MAGQQPRLPHEYVAAFHLPQQNETEGEFQGDARMRLGEIARRLGCTLEGDPEIEITGVASIEHAGDGEITFLADLRYRPALQTTRAAAILLAPAEGPVSLPALRSENPYLDFARAMGLFHQAPRYSPGIHPTAVVASSARIGPGAHIGPFCFVDEGAEVGRDAVFHSFVTIYRGVRIGDNFFAHSHVCIREGVQIGNNVTMQNGVVVGGDGFGFARRADGSWHKVPQTGIVVIEDDVEIQANSALDRATMGHTHIARGVKIDNLTHVGHASTVGEDTLLCAQVGLAGSTSVGKKCILAGQVGAAGHLIIGDGALVTAQSGVPHDLDAGGYYSGAPAMPHKLWLKVSALLPKLPELQQAVRRLQEELKEIRAAMRT
jgi:UDP-3-O-[3-hydroxymyristoyl] glucosamine N-acyltransferase